MQLQIASDTDHLAVHAVVFSEKVYMLAASDWQTGIVN